MDWTNPLVDADFEFAFSNLKSQISLVKVPTQAQIKVELVNKICELIASKNDGKDGKFGKYQLENERKRMQFWSIEQLTARLDEVVCKQTLNAKSLSELHQITQRPQSQEIVLPAEYTTERIRSMRAYEIKFLIRQFTVAAVNARLSGRN